LHYLILSIILKAGIKGSLFVFIWVLDIEGGFHATRRCATMLFLPGEEGQGLLEYGLILILVAIAIVAVVTLLGQQLLGFYTRVRDAWP
jgi:Flp pilus assembly pilin Flp